MSADQCDAITATLAHSPNHVERTLDIARQIINRLAALKSKHATPISRIMYRETLNYWLALISASVALVAAILMAGSIAGSQLESASLPNIAAARPAVIILAAPSGRSRQHRS